LDEVGHARVQGVTGVRRRFAIAALLAVTALPLAGATAFGGPLEPFRLIFKEPADTLKGLVVPKTRDAPEAPPAPSSTATPAAAPEPPAEASAVATAVPPVAADMPLPRLRPEAEGASNAEEPKAVAEVEEDIWADFTGPTAPPIDLSQHEDAIDALIASRSLGAVHKAANPDAQAIADGAPLGYATPGDDIMVMPNLRPHIASATGVLDEERSAAMSGALRPGGSCSKALSTLGVTAVSVDPIRAGGCGIPAPVEVAALGGGAVKLSMKAVVNCDVASTLAAFMRDTVDPVARQKLGASVSEIRVAAAYHCRTRNGVKGAKLSEHAKGNAIDISAFKVKGEWIVVGGKNGLAANAFLKDVRKAACGPFTTVLGPGSDAYHSDHFHFDLAQRGQSGRSLYCR